MIPTDPQDDLARDVPDTAAAPDEVEANHPPDAPPAPEEETDEQWMHRFLEENAHLARPRPERPPAPPPSPWDGPPSSWKVPDHLSMRHPRGGYMAMALMSRTMDDLDEVTKGERAATYEEVDKYFGHALIAEGLVPFTYTADQAIWWWKSGGYKVLGSQTVPHAPLAPIPLEGTRLDAPSNSGRGLPTPAAFWSGREVAIPDDHQLAGTAASALPSGSTDPAFLPTIWANASAAESDSPFADPVTHLVGDGPAKAPPGAAKPAPIATGSAAKVAPKAPAPRYGYRADPPTQVERLLALTGKIALEMKRSNGAASNDPYSADNLHLGVNDEYRPAMLKAARTFDLPPQTLAALIGAEASRNKRHEWDPKSRNKKTDASGLTQFMARTWLGEAERRGSYLNGLATRLGYLDKKGKIAATYKQAFLALRFDADHSINASADYAAFNLAKLKKRGVVLDESPAALARYAYLAHHEGLEGATDFLQGKPLSASHWKQNVPPDERQYWLTHYGPNLSTAYRAFMHKYTDDLIDVTDYMYDPEKVTAPPTGGLYGRPK